jgi:hypothetical protein
MSAFSRCGHVFQHPPCTKGYSDYAEQTLTAIVATTSPKLERNVMRKLSAVAIFVTIMITAPLPAIAYTQADADACTPDAMGLCASAVPDVRRVAFCLAHNKQQLNSACAAVFSRAQGARAIRERRENIQKTNF